MVGVLVVALGDQEVAGAEVVVVVAMTMLLRRTHLAHPSRTHRIEQTNPAPQADRQAPARGNPDSGRVLQQAQLRDMLRRRWVVAATGINSTPLPKLSHPLDGLGVARRMLQGHPTPNARHRLVRVAVAISRRVLAEHGGGDARTDFALG